MRKRILRKDSQDVPPATENWLDLERLAQVEVTSEDESHPVESALVPGAGPGWRASQPGEQIIRLRFDEPMRLRHIRLEFYEDKVERTQQFVVRWSGNESQSYREIVRQQYNFSPPATIQESEDYSIDLDGVMALELRIIPDIRGGPACASLAHLCLA